MRTYLFSAVTVDRKKTFLTVEAENMSTAVAKWAKLDKPATMGWFVKRGPAMEDGSWWPVTRERFGHCFDGFLPK